MPSEDSSTDECRHPREYNYAASGNAEWTRYYLCPDCKAKWTVTEKPEEPPLTPEEEEAGCLCGTPGAGSYEGPIRGCPIHGDLGVPGTPPRPVRRPPYAVAYGVAGHLYEVALPGDATVTAVDGALVIKHAVGFVAGITGVYPIENKEAS